MLEILQLTWLQLGAVGLLAASGWCMWWLTRKQLLELQEKYVELSEKTLVLNLELKSALEDIVEELSVGKLLNAYLDELDKRKG